MEQKLYPEEILSIFFKYERAETIHIKFPGQTHARHSLIKSFIGCSGYRRDNFDFSKYRLKLRSLSSITNEEMFELAKLVSPQKNATSNTYNEVKLKRKNDSAIYNIAGWTFIEIGFEHHEIKCINSQVYISPGARYDLGYQYLINKNFDMPMFFEVDHWANGKTPSQLNVAILV